MMKSNRANYQFKVDCSCRLAVTGSQGVLNCDLQPEFKTFDESERQFPIDAPGFIPSGSTIYFPNDVDDEPNRIPSLAMSITLDARFF